MREKQEFKVKDIVKLSKLPSLLITSLFDECDIYLSKRILCYVLAQQINIQISTDKDLSLLRGYVGELEDYTFSQLVNFTESHNIIIDTVDFKFRLWTVIFNNLEELRITHEILNNYLIKSDFCFEYASDVFKNLTRFVDESNDIDGQPFIIARESLVRFSTRDEIMTLGKNLDIFVPQKMSKELFLEYLLHKLEDNSEPLRAELSRLTLLELEEYAYNNYITADASLTNKDIINYILDDYSPKEHKIIEIDYINYLQIPTLSKGFNEEDFNNISDLKPKKVLDESLKDIISTVTVGETHKSEVEISEEESKEELDKIIDSIITSYNTEPKVAPKKKTSESLEDSTILKRIDDLEKRLTLDNNQQVVERETKLLRKIQELENKIKNSEVNDQKSDFSNGLVDRIALTEETDDEYSYSLDNVETGQVETEESEERLEVKLEESFKHTEQNEENSQTKHEDSEENLETIDDSKNIISKNESNDLEDPSEQTTEDIDESQKDYEDSEKKLEVTDDSLETLFTDEPNDLEDPCEQTIEDTFESKLESDEENYDYGIDDYDQGSISVGQDYEFADDDSLESENSADFEGNPSFENRFEDFIEEIHSAKGQTTIKAKRRISIKPVVVFWKSMIVWGSLIGLVFIVLILYSYFN